MLTPTHSNPYTSYETQNKANEIAIWLETAMKEFAQNQYSVKYILERYNEDHWNIQLKPIFLLKSRPYLFEVGLLKDVGRFTNTDGYYLMVTFWVENHHDRKIDVPGNDKIIEFCNLLRTHTNLPVRGWIGSREIYYNGQTYNA
jgi:hypothetical protein